MSGFPQSVIMALKKRSQGWCEGCGIAEATEAHHRQYRSRGGSDTLDNALHLCGWGNHTGCHGIAHTGLGEARGWSVRSGHSTLTVPMFRIATNSWVRLLAAPVLEPVHTADAIEFMQLIGARKVA